MAEDMQLRFPRMRKHAENLEKHHTQVDEMMLLMIQDGLGAMRYGQYGGSFPDPTSQAAFSSRTVVDAEGNPHDVVVWRDNRAEFDRAAYWAKIDLAAVALEEADTIRQRYMSANRDMWHRLDPTDFCRPHWFFMHTDPDLQKVIPRRAKGDLCKECNKFREDNGRPPEPLEAEFYSKNLRWPHKLYDPKERRAV